MFHSDTCSPLADDNDPGLCQHPENGQREIYDLHRPPSEGESVGATPWSGLLLKWLTITISSLTLSLFTTC